MLPVRPASWIGLIAVAILAAVAAADRLGFLGGGGDDLASYHNKTFLVVRSVDGDTIKIAARDGRNDVTTVRLWGVDTPEVGDPRSGGSDYFGPEASRFTRELCQDKSVRMELLADRTRDRTGRKRLLAYVYLPDGTMLNERLIEEGFGYADLRFEHVRFERFKHLEGRARRDGCGLWKNVRPNQWPRWRQRMVDDDNRLRRN